MKRAQLHMWHIEGTQQVSHIYCPQRIVKRFVVDKIGHEHLPYSYQKKKKSVLEGKITIQESHP